jgi:uncharacterized protein with FMN-binding domain
MRRAPFVLTSTVAGLAGVLSFHPRPPEVHARVASTSRTAPAGAVTTTGVAIDTRYGIAQVRVTIRGGKITDVVALALPGDEPKSLEISTVAEPLLRASALAKQTAVIDAVSGASITSAGYEASLQSALDKAGFTAADGTRGSSQIPQEEHDGRGGPGGPPDGFFGG